MSMIIIDLISRVVEFLRSRNLGFSVSDVDFVIVFVVYYIRKVVFIVYSLDLFGFKLRY